MISTTNFSKLLTFTLALVLSSNFTFAQTKKIKRPSSRVGISSVDRFVKESFDLYDKVYMYDGYAESGKPLTDEDIDVLENALDDLAGLSDSAPDIIGDLDGVGVLKQGKATLQINRAKKALKYSIKTAKELLAGERKRRETEGDTDETSSENEDESSDNNPTSENEQGNDSNIPDNSSTENTPVKINTKFDFVPGDELLFFDDFSQDFVGDFPSKWNTNGSGEVVTFNDDPEKWFEFVSGGGVLYVPDLNGLPENYTIEFDMKVLGVDRSTSSSARLVVILSDDNNLRLRSDNHVKTSIPVGQYSAFNIHSSNHFKGNSNQINSSVKADIRKAVLKGAHVSIAVNKNRFRLWVDDKKYVDIPRFIVNTGVLNYMKINVHNFKDGKEHIFIKNLKVAKGGVDLRRKLINEGSVSTNGILFDSGSARIKPQSYGIIKQISQVLQQEKTMSLKIVGHTDSDGGDQANMKLSKERANAVKQALVNSYGISPDRLTTDGLGESNPVADNTSAEGKAQNRRVEFIKQ